MKRTLIAILILLAATVAFAAPQGRRMQGPGPRGGALLPPPAFAEFLGLSAAQTEQVRTLRETERATVQPLAAQVRANQQQIEDALAAGNSARAGELVLANYKLRAQIKAAHDSFRTAFEALLDAGQKAKFAVYEEIVELRREARQQGPRRPGPRN